MGNTILHSQRDDEMKILYWKIKKHIDVNSCSMCADVCFVQTDPPVKATIGYMQTYTH